MNESQGRSQILQRATGHLAPAAVGPRTLGGSHYVFPLGIGFSEHGFYEIAALDAESTAVLGSIRALL